MATSAEALTLDAEDTVAAAEAAVRPLTALAFEPESFFLGRTEGAGVVRDPFGRITRRCHVVTDGSYSAAQGALRFDETFTYDDGEVDVWRWVMRAGHEGRYVAAEAKAGVGITGELRGGDYVLAFRRPVGRATGPLSPRFLSRITLLAPGLALKRAEVSLFGMPLGSLSAVHRRMAD
jgi:Protein of unknown function (DUF3833)